MCKFLGNTFPLKFEPPPPKKNPLLPQQKNLRKHSFNVFSLIFNQRRASILEIIITCE